MYPVGGDAGLPEPRVQASAQIPKGGICGSITENECERNAQKQGNSSTESGRPLMGKVTTSGDSEPKASVLSTPKSYTCGMNMVQLTSAIHRCPTPPSHRPELSLLPATPTHTPSASEPQQLCSTVAEQLLANPAVRVVLRMRGGHLAVTNRVWVY